MKEQDRHYVQQEADGHWSVHRNGGYLKGFRYQDEAKRWALAADKRVERYELGLAR